MQNTKKTIDKQLERELEIIGEFGE